MNEILTEELDAVRAILMDGIEVDDDGEGGITTINISLHPLTANEDEKSYVSLTLEISIPPGYPDVAPEVAVSTYVPLFIQLYPFASSVFQRKAETESDLKVVIIVLLAIDPETPRASRQQRGSSPAPIMRTP